MEQVQAKEEFQFKQLSRVTLEPLWSQPSGAILFVRGHYIGILIYLLTPSRSLTSMVCEWSLVVTQTFPSTVSMCFSKYFIIMCSVECILYFLLIHMSLLSGPG